MRFEGTRLKVTVFTTSMLLISLSAHGDETNLEVAPSATGIHIELEDGVVWAKSAVAVRYAPPAQPDRSHKGTATFRLTQSADLFLAKSGADTPCRIVIDLGARSYNVYRAADCRFQDEGATLCIEAMEMQLANHPVEPLSPLLRVSGCAYATPSRSMLEREAPTVIEADGEWSICWRGSAFASRLPVHVEARDACGDAHRIIVEVDPPGPEECPNLPKSVLRKPDETASR